MLLALLLGPAGCSGPAPTRITLPQPPLITARDALCVPGRRWDRHPTGDRWRFSGVTSIFCSVSAPMEGPLALHLQPDEQTSGFAFAASWDGERLFTEPVRMPLAGYDITIPVGNLSPGTHELRLERKYQPGESRLPGWHENNFLELGYSTPASYRSIPVDQEPALRYLADFLELGIAGLGKEKWSGLLFEGPGSASLDLEAGPATAVELRVENNSAAEAAFTVTGGELQQRIAVPAGQRSTLTLELPRRSSELTLTVEGAEDGLFLWSHPRLGLGPGSRSHPPRRPPIVLITLDTTRRDALSVYGGPAPVTPNLAAFASHATVFDRAYSTTSWTLPAHTSMMTGLAPSRHAAGIFRMSLSWQTTTAADLLAAAGYVNAGLAGGEVCSAHFGVGKGFHLYRDPDQFETRGDRLTNYALEILERSPIQPIFLFVNYFDPHAPYQAPEAFQKLLDLDAHRPALEGSPLWQSFDRGNIQGWVDIVDGKGENNPGIRAYARAAYLAEVAFMDQQVGRLLDALRSEGLYEEALIVVVADHGEMLGEDSFPGPVPYWGHAGRLDPELTEVPLIVKWPHQRKPKRVGDLVSVVDIFPTLLAAAGLEAPESDGRLLTPEGIDDTAQERSYVLMEEHHTPFHPLRPMMMIAPSIYGIQGTSSRRVVWQDGQSCARRRGEGWEPVPCSGEASVIFEQVRKLLGTGELLEAAAGRSLSAHERQALEALGYL